LVQRNTGLFDQSLQRAGFQRLVLWDNHGAVRSAEDAMRARLANLNETESPQGGDCVSP
jgi:hypothetical protein